MEVKISYRQLESQPQIEERISSKASKLKKFFNGKMHVNWTCSKDGDMHHSDATVRGDHFEVHATCSDSNLFKSVDEVADRLEKQIQRKNEQIKEKLHTK
ncbi:MAG: ribosome-associated translation inhibitor RaiA [Bacteriovoracaceae bacterium]|nr:ribosome-associated translation inhibitor RaiA [Bacteriovoracaceae bacterium]